MEWLRGMVSAEERQYLLLLELNAFHDGGRKKVRSAEMSDVKAGNLELSRVSVYSHSTNFRNSARVDKRIDRCK
jgi:hypothetical protein